MQALRTRGSPLVTRRPWIVTCSIALAVAACAGGRDDPRDTAGSTAAGAGATGAAPAGGQAAGELPPPEFGQSIESVPRAQIARYAASLQFVTDPLLIDEQPMLYRAGTAQASTRGPMARIQSERRASTITDQQLRRGRIIARIVSAGSYEPLGLRRGANYLWVDSAAGGWRAVMIPETATDPLKVLKVRISGMPHESRLPAARLFFVDPYGMLPWPTCGLNKCCMPCDPALGFCPDFGQLMDALGLGPIVAGRSELPAGGPPPR